MSLKMKIALGVLAATAILAVALVLLGVDASQRLNQAAELQRTRLETAARAQREKIAEQFSKVSEETQARSIKAVEDLILAWVNRYAGYPKIDLANALRDEGNGLREAAIIDRNADNTLYIQVCKGPSSELVLGRDELAVATRVFDTGKREFLGDQLYLPYSPETDQIGRPKTILRLTLNIPQMQRVELPAPDVPQAISADLRPLAIISFITLAICMLAVFLLLTTALRRLVFRPLDDVLENSKRIVTGSEGLEIKGLVQGSDDIETLVAAFNAMFNELKEYQADLEGKVKNATRTIERQQQSLVVAQRLAATGTLAAGLAHEINNPLSGMLNAARRLKAREGLDERAKDYVELIEDGLRRIEELMKQILDFSRRREMKPERFEAERVVKRSLPLVRHRLEKRGLKLEEDLRPEVPMIYGNEEELSQVVMNLLINAADAAPDGGTVRVVVSPGPHGGVEIAVEDSGTGVPDDLRERIFDPFFTTKEPGKGTGLGLAIVLTIVSNHGGTVRVERSEKLGGARFVIDLPSAERSETTRRLARQDIQ
ncbi:MAG: HAMP domain-containing histidine kinase [Planctomycetes bacterium]|nr:HAMP domain-containing histidine kinase [Planctomycetota bacterium]